MTTAVQAEARARQAETLAQIGALAANVAHEIRNPLAAISSTLQVLGASLSLDRTQQQILSKVRGQVLRLDRLVTDLLGYARPLTARQERVELLSVVKDALIQSTVDAEIQQNEPSVIRADRNMVCQILINLLQNGRAAAGPRGKVRVVLGPGPKVCVEDDGPGVDPTVLSQIFEPFVTTKAKGTGLGLAISKRLATGMEGQLSLEPSTLGSGARFQLQLREWREDEAGGRAPTPLKT